jgi:hypothetical protein
MAAKKDALRDWRRRQERLGSGFCPLTLAEEFLNLPASFAQLSRGSRRL